MARSMSFHPIQLNFGQFVDNPILSDINLKATVFDQTKDSKSPTTPINNDENDSKYNDPTIPLDVDDTNTSTTKLSNHSSDDTISAHWDFLRSRCIIFDLIFHAMTHDKSDRIPLHGVHVDTNTNTIHFDVCYDALLIVVKYLYTGLLRRYEYEDIMIARDVMKLADILHLTHLAVDINGQFISSRKQLKETQLNQFNEQKLNQHDDHDDDTKQDDDEWSEWKALKLDSFDFEDWNPMEVNGYFLNPKVLYHFDVAMYSAIPSRQRIVIGDRYFQISKVIYVAVSCYFRAMFCGSKWAESHESPSKVMVMKSVNADDFERLQSFLYTFDPSTYSIVCADDECTHSVTQQMDEKQVLLRNTLNAWNLSIFFGIEDLRQCLLLLIDRHYLCKATLAAFWNLGFENEWKDIKELCANYFAREFINICNDTQVFHSLTKRMIQDGLAKGSIAVETQLMIQVLVTYCNFHGTSIQELLPPHTLFNEANKSYVLQNRRPISVQHLLQM